MDNKPFEKIFKDFVKDRESLTNIDSRVLLIDSLNIFIRAWTGNPSINYQNKHVGGLLGFIQTLQKVVDKFRPTRVVCVFDGQQSHDRRKKIYPQYKEGRNSPVHLNRFLNLDATIDPEESFKSQMERLELYLDLLPIATILMSGLEADDVIGYITSDYYKKTDNEVIIISADTDYFQLLEIDKVKVYSPLKDVVYDRKIVEEEYEIPIENFLLYRSLVGDSSDNILGVNGLGLKTLKTRFPEITKKGVTLNEIIEHSKEELKNKKLKIYERVSECREVVERNFELMSLFDLSFSGKKKLLINRQLESPIPKLDIFTFGKLFRSDGLHKITNDFFERNLNRTFYNLSTYAK